MMHFTITEGLYTVGMVGILSAWVLTYLAHSTLLLSAAWLAGRWVASPAVREVFWKLAVVGPLLTGSAALLLPARQDVLIPPLAKVTEMLAVAPPLPAGPSLPSALAAMVVGVWLLGASLGVCRLELGRRAYWRLMGRRETLADEETVSALRRLQDTAGCTRTVYVTTSRGIGAPAAMGQAEICLPADSFSRLSPVQRESVLAHELGHIVRRDPLWRFTTDVLAAVFLIQPLLRVARRELRECAEMLCDDFAIRLTGRRRPLVESLAILASSLRPTSAPASSFGEGDSPLFRRAARLLDGSRAPARSLGRPATAMLTAGALAGTLALAPTVAAPRAGIPPKTIFLRLPPDIQLAPADLSAGARLTVWTLEEDEQITVHQEPGGELRQEYSRGGVITGPVRGRRAR